MSYPEKRNLVALLGTLVFAFAYTYYLFTLRGEGNLSSLMSFSEWGGLVLTVLGVKIAFNISVHILFNILNAIATKEREPQFIDELDNLIELKALMYAFTVFMIGFFIAILCVAMG
jgi:hypothetical protein